MWRQPTGSKRSAKNSEDHAELLDLVRRAFQKLDGSPVQIPHMEHRQLHLLLYSRLNNPFVTESWKPTGIFTRQVV